jgi:hypothetical protein
MVRAGVEHPDVLAGRTAVPARAGRRRTAAARSGSRLAVVAVAD